MLGPKIAATANKAPKFVVGPSGTQYRIPKEGMTDAFVREVKAAEDRIARAARASAPQSPVDVVKRAVQPQVPQAPQTPPAAPQTPSAPQPVGGDVRQLLDAALRNAPGPPRRPTLADVVPHTTVPTPDIPSGGAPLPPVTMPVLPDRPTLKDDDPTLFQNIATGLRMLSPTSRLFEGAFRRLGLHDLADRYSADPDAVRRRNMRANQQEFVERHQEYLKTVGKMADKLGLVPEAEPGRPRNVHLGIRELERMVAAQQRAANFEAQRRYEMANQAAGFSANLGAPGASMRDVSLGNPLSDFERQPNPVPVEGVVSENAAFQSRRTQALQGALGATSPTVAMGKGLYGALSAWMNVNGYGEAEYRLNKLPPDQRNRAYELAGLAAVVGSSVGVSAGRGGAVIGAGKDVYRTGPVVDAFDVVVEGILKLASMRGPKAADPLARLSRPAVEFLVQAVNDGNVVEAYRILKDATGSAKAANEILAAASRKAGTDGWGAIARMVRTAERTAALEAEDAAINAVVSVWKAAGAIDGPAGETEARAFIRMMADNASLETGRPRVDLINEMRTEVVDSIPDGVLRQEIEGKISKKDERKLQLAAAKRIVKDRPAVVNRDMDDETIVQKLVEQTLRELEEWRRLRGAEYRSFYVDDNLQAQERLRRWVAEKYNGRQLTDGEVKLWTLMSALASPQNNPINDTSLGTRLFDRYLRTGQISPYVKDAERYAYDVFGKKSGIGIVDVRDGLTRPGKGTTAYEDEGLVVFDRILRDHFGGDLDKAFEWLTTKHPIEEIERVTGRPVASGEYGRTNIKGLPQDDVYGIFGLTGIKLGSYILNRLGILDTVTKDMWVARTAARWFGERLWVKKVVEEGEDGEEGKVVEQVIKEPWSEKSAKTERLRRLLDAAWTRVADQLGVKPANVQEMMWDFEQKMWASYGSPGQSGFVSEGVEDGIRRLAQNESFDVYTPFRAPTPAEAAEADAWTRMENYRNELFSTRVPKSKRKKPEFITPTGERRDIPVDEEGLPASVDPKTATADQLFGTPVSSQRFGAFTLATPPSPVRVTVKAGDQSVEIAAKEVAEPSAVFARAFDGMEGGRAYDRFLRLTTSDAYDRAAAAAKRAGGEYPVAVPPGRYDSALATVNERYKAARQKITGLSPKNEAKAYAAKYPPLPSDADPASAAPRPPAPPSFPTKGITHTVDENVQVFLTPDGKAGIKIKGDQVQSMFVLEGAEPTADLQLLQVAIEHGARSITVPDNHVANRLSRLSMWPAAQTPGGEAGKWARNASPDVAKAFRENGSVSMVFNPAKHMAYHPGKSVLEENALAKTGLKAQEKILKKVDKLRASAESKRLKGETKLFYQSGESGAAGWYDVETGVIGAIRGVADFSTFIHETSHHFFNPKHLSSDTVRLLERHFGKAGTTGYYEGSARALERYFWEGDAPSVEVASVFERIRRAMRAIYAKIKGTPLEDEIPAEVRRLFDRIFQNRLLREARESAQAKQAKAAPARPAAAARSARRAMAHLTDEEYQQFEDAKRTMSRWFDRVVLGGGAQSGGLSELFKKDPEAAKAFVYFAKGVYKQTMRSAQEFFDAMSRALGERSAEMSREVVDDVYELLSTAKRTRTNLEDAVAGWHMGGQSGPDGTPYQFADADLERIAAEAGIRIEPRGSRVSAHEALDSAQKGYRGDTVQAMAKAYNETPDLKRKPLGPVDQFKLALREAELTNRLKAQNFAMDLAVQRGDDRAVAEMAALIDETMSQLQEVLDAGIRSGAAWSDAGRARQLALKNDFSPSGMKRMFASTLKRAPTKKEAAEIERMADKVDETSEKFLSAVERAVAESFKKKDAIYRKVKRERVVASAVERLKQKLEALKKAEQETATLYSSVVPFLPSVASLTGKAALIAPEVMVIAKAMFDSGIENARELVPAVSKFLNEQGVDIAEQDVVDILILYTRTKGKTSGEVVSFAKMVREMRRAHRERVAEEIARTNRQIEKIRRESIDWQKQFEKAEAAARRRALTPEEKAARDEAKRNAAELKARQKEYEARKAQLEKEARKEYTDWWKEQADRMAAEEAAEARKVKAAQDAEWAEADRALRAEQADFDAQRRREQAESAAEYKRWWAESEAGQTTGLLERAERYRTRLREGQLPKKRKTYDYDSPDYQQAEIEYYAAQFEYRRWLAQKRAEEEYENLPTWKKALRNVAELWQLPRALVATLDLSFGYNQGAFVALSHPGTWLRHWPDTLRSLRSESQFQAMAGKIHGHRRYRESLAAGLRLHIDRNEPHEFFMSNLVDRIPGIGAATQAANRAYLLAQSRMALDLYTQMVDDLERLAGGMATTKLQRQLVAEYVNTATGVGTGSVASSLATLNTSMHGLFFAPGYRTSRWKLALGTPLMNAIANNDRRVAAMIARDYVRVAGSMASIAGAALASGAQVETDPKSNRFMMIRIGDSDIWVDPFSGLLTPWRIIWQSIHAERKDHRTGQARKVQFFDPMVRYTLSGLSPQARGVSYLFDPDQFGKNYDVKTMDGLWTFLGETAVPIMIQQNIEMGLLPEQWEANGLTPSQRILAFLGSVVGANTQQYMERPLSDALPHRHPVNEELRRILRSTIGTPKDPDDPDSPKWGGFDLRRVPKALAGMDDEYFDELAKEYEALFASEYYRDMPSDSERRALIDRSRSAVQRKIIDRLTAEGQMTREAIDERARRAGAR